MFTLPTTLEINVTKRDLIHGVQFEHAAVSDCTSDTTGTLVFKHRFSHYPERRA